MHARHLALVSRSRRNSPSESAPNAALTAMVSASVRTLLGRFRCVIEGLGWALTDPGRCVDRERGWSGARRRLCETECGVEWTDWSGMLIIIRGGSGVGWSGTGEGVVLVAIILLLSNANLAKDQWAFQELAWS
jgi:hypothetical protein